ncbi:MAG: argininosuccinate lyase [Saprospiraceae bacterium]|nr:argininosuccinate lyase [Saprospiraceae bacterium]
MKLWDKGYAVHDIVDRYTVGDDRALDLLLAKYDVQGSVAHAKMLQAIGMLTEAELADILRGLDAIGETIAAGDFVIEAQFEDVHSKIEYELVQRIGEAGKKIHSARSRNDQVLVDLHLYFKAEIQAIQARLRALFELLTELAEQHKAVLMPGYTHLQVAMPSSFGLWFGAYAESLIDDLVLLNAAYRIADQNPLGSAAGYGSSFPINRAMTTELLGFSTLKYNVVAAQMSRGKLEKTVTFALAGLAGTLSKFANDAILYMSQNFNFISLPKELTTGSSIMPHKQNPDVFEILRARCNKIQSLPNEIILLTNNLTSGYHRDLQVLKESLLPAVESTKDNLEVCHFMLRHLKVNENILDDDRYDYLYSVEAVNKLVMDGIPFRDAYQQLGKAIASGDFQPEKSVHHTHEGSLGNLCLDEIRAKFEANWTELGATDTTG